MPLISPKFYVKSIIFHNFGQRPFPKIAGKSPGLYSASIGNGCHYGVTAVTTNDNHYYCQWYSIVCFREPTQTGFLIVNG